MELKIKQIGKLGKAKLFFDPLRKNDSFIILKEPNDVKTGFILNEEVVFESNANIKWENVTGIIGGFSDLSTFKKIQEILYDKALNK